MGTTRKDDVCPRFRTLSLSFLRAAQGCGALVLAGAMVLPMTPALAQDAAPVANAPGQML